MDWYSEMGGVYNINGEKIFGRKIFVKDNGVDNVRNNKFKNIDVYKTAYKYEDKNNQNGSNIIGPLYLDLDGEIKDEQSYKSIKQDALFVLNYLSDEFKVDKKYIEIYFSGNKGFHFIIQPEIFGITPCKDLNMKYKLIAIDANKHTINKCVDIRIYDKKRLIRLPHSINGKTGLYKVPVTEPILRASTYISICSYAKIDRIKEIKAPSYNRESQIAFNKKLQELNEKHAVSRQSKKTYAKDNNLLPCVTRLYNTSVKKGARNNTLIVLASLILQKNDNDIDEAIDLLTVWNNENNPPMSNTELLNTIHSASEGLKNGRKYGCSSIQDLGMCVERDCRLYKGR